MKLVLSLVLLTGCTMGVVDRALLESRITLLGETAALGKTPEQAAALRAETAELVSDVDAAIR